MRHRHYPVFRFLVALLVALFVAGTLGPRALAQGNRSDAVEDLRFVLKAPARDLAARARNVKQCVERLRNIHDLRRALVLQEWRDEDPDEPIAGVDGPVRAALAQRFEQAVRAVLQRGDSTSRLAVANMLGELGARARGVKTRGSLARGFGPDLVPLLKDTDPQVRQTAARALGQILPAPEVAAPALGTMLTARDAADRLAAAEGLAGAVRVTCDVGLRSRATNGVEMSRTEMVQALHLLVPVAALGINGEQIEVRRYGVQAIGLAAKALSMLVPELRLPIDPDELEEFRRTVEDELTSLRPLILMLKEQGPVLTRSLIDADAEVRLLARKALEDGDLANERLLALRRAGQTAAAELTRRAGSLGQPVQASATKSSDELVIEGLHTRVAALAAGISDKDVRARRAAIDVLESLGAAATAAAPALVQALADPDHFVRWAAARTLGKIGPVETKTAVPALARLLADNDLDVRMAAATALERFGPAAAPAVQALVQAMGTSDVEMRLVAMRALQGIGPEAHAATPRLTQSLSDPDGRVRQTAAQTLGKFGPAARAAVGELRKLLNDENTDVRRAASASLLAIVASPPR